jgi:phosphotransferase system HPr-like phosphotransfer protein
MVEQEIFVSNVLGIHARPAALIVQLSNKFASEVWLEKDGVKADAKSIMCAKGREEHQAVDALVNLFKSNFNE